MGKGDIKTKKGKRHIGSFGKHRLHKPKPSASASASADRPKGKPQKTSKEEQKSS